MRKLACFFLATFLFAILGCGKDDPVSSGAPESSSRSGAKLVVSADKARGAHDRLPPSAYWGFRTERTGAFHFAVYEDRIQEIEPGYFKAPVFRIYFASHAWATNKFAISIPSRYEESFGISGVPGVPDQILKTKMEPEGYTTPINISFGWWGGTIVVTSQESGVFALFCLEAGGEITPIAMSDALGDVNGDGEMTISDALMVAAHIQNGGVLTEPWQLKVADFDRNGVIRMIDSINIAQTDIGLPLIKLGDVNLDGNIQSFDALIIIDHLSGVDLITDMSQLSAADVDQDGEVTQNDADMIQDIIAHKISHPKE